MAQSLSNKNQVGSLNHFQEDRITIKNCIMYYRVVLKMCIQKLCTQLQILARISLYCIIKVLTC